MFKHILVPTDGSELSHDTAHAAVDFAKVLGAKITAFYAKPEFPVTYYGEGALIEPNTPEQFSALAEKQAAENLAFIENLCRDGGVACDTWTLTSDVPYEAILQAASERSCDLIFMSSHGRHGLGAWLLGSETNRVISHSTLPVLVYRLRDPESA